MPKVKQIAEKVRSTSRNEVKEKQSKNQQVQIIDKKKQVQESDSEQSDNEFSKPNILYAQGSYLAYVDPSSDDPTQFKICQLSEDVFDIENDEEQYQCSIYEPVNQTQLEFDLAHKISFVFAFTIICPVKFEIQKKQNLQKMKISKQELSKIQRSLPAILKAIQHESSDQEESEDDSVMSDEIEIDQLQVPQQQVRKMDQTRSISQNPFTKPIIDHSKNSSNISFKLTQEEIETQQSLDKQNRINQQQSQQLSNNQQVSNNRTTRSRKNLIQTNQEIQDKRELFANKISKPKREAIKSSIKNSKRQSYPQQTNPIQNDEEMKEERESEDQNKS